MRIAAEVAMIVVRGTAIAALFCAMFPPTVIALGVCPKAGSFIKRQDVIAVKRWVMEGRL